MPFITEELWQHIYDRKEGESLMVHQLDIPAFCNETIIKEFEEVKEVIKNIREIYQKYNINFKEDSNALSIGKNNPISIFIPLLSKLTNVFIRQEDSSITTDIIFIVQNQKYALSLGKNIAKLEIDRMEAELKYKIGFLESIRKKLNNEKFISKAPANVIDMERKKMLDAENTITSLKDSILKLKELL